MAEDFEALFSVVDTIDRWLDALGPLGRSCRRTPSRPARPRPCDFAELVASVGASAKIAPPGGARDPLATAPRALPRQGRDGLSLRAARRAATFPATIPCAIIAKRRLACAGAGVLSPRERSRAHSRTYDPCACNLVLRGDFDRRAAAEVEQRVPLRGRPGRVRRSEVGPSTEGRPRPHLSRGRAKPLRIDAERVDRLAGLAGDLVVAKNGLSDLAAQAEALPGGQALGRALRARHGPAGPAGRRPACDGGQGASGGAGTLVRTVPRSAQTARSLGKDVSLAVEEGRRRGRQDRRRPIRAPAARPAQRDRPWGRARRCSRARRKDPDGQHPVRGQGGGGSGCDRGSRRRRGGSIRPGSAPSRSARGLVSPGGRHAAWTIMP